MLEKVTSEDVVDALSVFFFTYDQWRKQNGLSGSIDNVHEICNSMTDKHGRICRQVKHVERNDPKSDWPTGMTEAMMGYLVYMIMLMNKYSDTKKPGGYRQGFLNELNAAIDQHS